MRACLFTFHTYRHLHLLQNYGFNKVAKPEAVAQVFCKKGVLRNFTKFTGKHLCQCLFFNKAALKACNFVKKETRWLVLVKTSSG